jgi:GNAT superfamily N-acetyltransferase
VLVESQLIVSRIIHYIYGPSSKVCGRHHSKIGFLSNIIMDKKTWEWERVVDSKNFIISSARELMPNSFVQEAFATEAMFWAQPLSNDGTRAMLDSSLTLGIYKLSDAYQKEPIGLARMITDYTTIAFLTDVYIADAYRGLGLGRWVIQCCREVVLEMSDLRFMLLFTGSTELQKLYRDQLGMEVVGGPESSLACMRARSKNLAEAAAATQRTTDGPGTKAS